MYLIFDTETTGLPQNYSAPISDTDNWPRLVQLAWQLHGPNGELISNHNYIVKPVGFTIPFNSQKIHGISTQRALDEGHDLSEVLEIFKKDLARTQATVGHNVEFDNNIVGCEYYRMDIENNLQEIYDIDTSEVSIEYCQLPGGKGGRLKKPKLIELYTKLFGEGFSDAHDAAYDVDATSKAFFGLIKEGVIEPLDGTPVTDITYEAPKLDAANFAVKDKKAVGQFGTGKVDHTKIDTPFCHLHLHSQFSILQATPDIKGIVKKAKEENTPATQ